MSNINANRVNATLTEPNLSTIKSLFTQLQSLMPFLIGLNADERRSIPKINVNNKAFTEDALNILRNNAGLFPAFVNANNMATDLILYQQLDELATLSRQLSEKIEDTRMLAGSEAYISALSIYRLVAAAATAGMPGADVLYQQLRERFAGIGGGAAGGPADTTGGESPATE